MENKANDRELKCTIARLPIILPQYRLPLVPSLAKTQPVSLSSYDGFSILMRFVQVKQENPFASSFHGGMYHLYPKIHKSQLSVLNHELTYRSILRETHFYSSFLLHQV
ncbi:hypothetical protein E2C01_017099 [Portunus trituberculatus]|uniref:Uncharacterized protein n=1 Tax=Portunus trituberculatus TaxID=210409 RepID=A0A5B7DSI8_PORTR|nr:hypothetical protein [Portunus trituberculatus]